MTLTTSSVLKAPGRSEDLYLALMKKALSFALWPEPPISIETFNYWRSSLLLRQLVSGVSKLLKRKRLHLVYDREVTADQREQGLFWPGCAHTMIGFVRLDNLQMCVETALGDGVKGDLIETGAWRGGACILMRAVLAAYNVTDRIVYVADSFEGLPRPDPTRFPADRGDKHYRHQFLAVSQEEVEENFRTFGLLDDQVVFLKGWFKDTLPQSPIEHLAVLRLDGDMYGSTMDALTNLYPKLSTGGFCIIDDYALKGCRQAVDDYRAEHKIAAPIQTIDWTGIYWRKDG
jgi:hypothetical protein